jgi:hypothetical protein
MNNVITKIASVAKASQPNVSRPNVSHSDDTEEGGGMSRRLPEMVVECFLTGSADDTAISS